MIQRMANGPSQHAQKFMTNFKFHGSRRLVIFSGYMRLLALIDEEVSEQGIFVRLTKVWIRMFVFYMNDISSLGFEF